MKNNIDLFFIGALAGAFTGGVAVILSLEESQLKSPKRINPTIELTTDGKTVDTLYVYKQ